MKKILGISLCALFAVSAANADIASTQWVNQQVGGMDLPQTGEHYVKVVSQADGKVSATAERFEGTLNAATQDNAPTSKAVADHVKGAIDALDVTAIQGDYIKAVSQADGKVSATAESFAGEVTAGGTNAPTAGAVATYVDEKVSNLQGSIDDLGDLAYKNTVANDDVAEGAAIETTKIAFTDAQKNALSSGIDSTKVGQIATNTGNIATNTTSIGNLNTSMSGLEGRVEVNEGDIDALEGKVNAMVAAPTEGNYVKVVSQENGKVVATGKTFETTLSADTNDNAPTSMAVATYVATQVQNATPNITTGTTPGAISVNNAPVSVYGLGDLALDDAVTTDTITDGAIMDADINTDAKIASTKIKFTDVQDTVFTSGINSGHVTQIGTNARNIASNTTNIESMGGQVTTNKNNITDLQGRMTTAETKIENNADAISAINSILNATGTEACNTAAGCTLVHDSTGFKWEAVTRAAN